MSTTSGLLEPAELPISVVRELSAYTLRSRSALAFHSSVTLANASSGMTAAYTS